MEAGPSSNQLEPRYDVFLAHAGCDTDQAKDLFTELERRGLRTCFDAESLLLGDAWDTELSQAQRQSAITVVIVSPEALSPPGGREAHYWLEEISTGIELSRSDPNRHRIVPLYLKADPALKRGVPYGLRRLHSMLMTDVTEVAEALAALLERLRQRTSHPPIVDLSLPGEVHDILIEIEDQDLRFIHLSGGRIAEATLRYDEAFLRELHPAKIRKTYDLRVAKALSRSLLPKPLRKRLERLDEDDRVRFHLSESAWSLPWELLALKGLPLSLRCPTSRRPRNETSPWINRAQLSKKPTVLIVTSGCYDLPGVRREAEDIAKLWKLQGARVRLAWNPDVLDFEDELAERYDLLHFAGHAWFDGQTGESYLWLGNWILDGEHTGYKYSITRLIEAISTHPPTVVCLNSHFTALVGPVFRPPGCPEGPSERARIGFARPLINAGVASFIGTYGSPDDEHAGDFGVLFNQELASGLTVGDAAFGGRQWARAAHSGGAHSDATVASYIVAGDADCRITDGVAAPKAGVIEETGVPDPPAKH